MGATAAEIPQQLDRPPEGGDNRPAAIATIEVPPNQVPLQPAELVLEIAGELVGRPLATRG